MTPLDPAVCALLLVVALPLGLALSSGLLPARSRIARFGTATLAGLGVLAGLAHALMCLGVKGRVSVPVLAALGVVAGAWSLARSVRRGPAREASAVRDSWVAKLLLEAGPAALVLLLLLVPFCIAHEFAIDENDAVRIWAPKAVRALDEAPPTLTLQPGHAHPEYPRGLGILTAAAAAPSGEVDARMPRMVPLFLFALALLCVFDALSVRQNLAGAYAGMLILGSVPTILRQATSGLADLPLAGFILLGGVGLAPQRGGRPAVLVALAGASGALVTKDEGLVFFGALVAVLAVKLARAGRRVPALATLAASAILAAPWVALRSAAHGGEPFLFGSIVPNAGLVMMRFDLMVRELGYLALNLPNPSPGQVALPDVVPGADLVVHIAILCAVVLTIGRGGRFPVLPVGILFLVDFLVVLLTPVGVEWQLVTAYNRLVLQGLPLLIVSAVDKLTTPEDDVARAEARAVAAA